MHPESQSLEASFEPAAGPPDSSSSIAPQDPVVEDFNKFFERLSSLDNLQWSAAPAAGATAPASPAPAAPAAPPAAAARPRRKAPARTPGATGGKPRMTVLKSDTDLVAPPGNSAEPSAEPADVPSAARSRIGVREVARFLKLTLVGLVLFALGLGAGWAALSLPGRFDDSRTSFADMMERTRAMALPRVEAGKAASAPGDRLRVVEAASGAGTATPLPGSDDAAGTEEPETGFVMASPERPARAPSSASRKVVAPAAAPTARTAVAGNAAVADTAVANTASANMAGGSTALTEPSAEARFTLQVGACSSFACVENYRHLLLEKVSPRAIKVVSQPQAQGGATIQRIRVQPLERGEAERLKADLAAQDARFNDAYVIALR